MKIAITGGGTGGHLVIAKALKEEAIAQGSEVIYIGSTYGQDRSWFENDSDFKNRYFFDTSGVVNKRGLRKIGALWGIFKAFIRAFFILRREKIDAVISVGGYSAAPASFAALLSRRAFFIHEQNATVGKLNALLRPFAKEFFSSYTTPAYDYPVRQAFFETARERAEVKRIIFLGGSQGAKAINDLALRLALKLEDMGIKIIHQSGKNDFSRVKEAYTALGIQAELFDFSTSMPVWLAKADMAIARSGASTVWEITANQLPTLFIPYPYAAKDHQAANAKRHVDAQASWMMREEEIDDEKILAIIQKGVSMESQKLSQLLKADGVKKIIEKIKEYHA